METWAVTNEEQARDWNGDEAAHWLVHEERYERMLAAFTDHLLAAFANIACGLRRGGRLVFVCWQKLAGNEWVAVFGAAAQAALEPYLTPDGVLLGSRAWLVTASRP